jgi:putative ABC transport system permease protein
MSWIENIKISLRAIRKNKLRTFLTMLGVIIGVSSVIVLISLGRGFRDEIVSEIEGIGSNTMLVIPGEVDTSSPSFSGSSLFGDGVLTRDDLEKVRERVSSSEISVSGVVLSSGRVEKEGEVKNVFIIGTDEQYAFGESIDIDSGRFLNQKDVERTDRVVFLGSKIAKDFFGSRTAIGEDIVIEGKKYRVLGVAENSGTVSLGPDFNEAVYIPYTTSQKYINDDNSLDRISIDVGSVENVRSIQKQVEAIVQKNHGGVKDFSVITQDEILSVVDSVVEILTLFLASIGSISLLVGGIGIMNIMLVSVTERTREIGIRKAIGATSTDIRNQFLTEAVVLSALGGFSGIVLSAIILGIASYIIGFNIFVTWDSALLAFAVSFIVGVFFGVFPATRAAKLDPIDALRYE